MRLQRSWCRWSPSESWSRRSTCRVASAGWRARCAWPKPPRFAGDMAQTILLGLDVGGSSIKAGLVDTGRGSLTTPLHSVRTPTPSTPEAVLQECARIDGELGGAGPVGLAFPSVVQAGIARTAANVDKSWIGFAGGARLAQLIGRPVIFLNDADAAGVAEISAGGAGKDEPGVVLLLT